MTFGENLKQIRESAQLSQDDLARILKVDQKTISNWEKDITEPTLTFIKILAKHFDLTYEMLMDTE